MSNSKKKQKKENKVDTEPKAFKCKIKCPYKKMNGLTWGEVAKKYPWYVRSLMKGGYNVPDIIYEHFFKQVWGSNQKDIDKRDAAENCYRQKRYSTQKDIFM